MPLFGAECDIVHDDIFYHVKQLLNGALPGDDVYLVSPYLQLDNKVSGTIREAVSKGIVLHLLMRPDSKISLADYEFLATERIDVKELQNLHAKVYWSQDKAIVTSMNLYRYSESNNHELAVIFKDRDSVNRIKESVARWWKDAKVVSVMELASRARGKSTIAESSPQSKFSEKAKIQTANEGARSSDRLTGSPGFCIRCGKSRPFNVKSPLCPDCYKVWNVHKNDQYKEKQCHRCGKPYKTTINQPLCNECT